MVENNEKKIDFIRYVRLADCVVHRKMNGFRFCHNYVDQNFSLLRDLQSKIIKALKIQIYLHLC